MHVYLSGLFDLVFPTVEYSKSTFSKREGSFGDFFLHKLFYVFPLYTLIMLSHVIFQALIFLFQ